MSDACGASGALSAVHLDALARRPGILREVLDAGPELRCSLGQHTGPHMDVLHEDPAPGNTLWARWPGDAVLALPDCPATGSGEGCGQYLSHPGGHTWQVADPTL
ncbi:hypothetical protein OHA37_15555 [Streptomyces sp. NBC_00335]|uniref:hypothetical protein n=1 Tax=unclassified Streptomyces TaxID=2593676 RepID=UPI00224F3534|nr:MULTISPECIES: hypothetical protein [unclassified Streptomyces]MCX5405297.1 hypothetical protein [Streptomyces sp. NBC_00086]